MSASQQPRSKTIGQSLLQVSKICALGIALLLLVGFFGAWSTSVSRNDLKSIVGLKWKSLNVYVCAHRGIAWAQYQLATKYVLGSDGLTQDYGKAAKWYRKAAEQGIAKAQHNLAWMYEKGQGSHRDLVEAYKWHSLAASLGSPHGVGPRDRLKDSMTPEQIAEAERRVVEWKSKAAPKGKQW